MPVDLPALFGFVRDRLEAEREALNAADAINGNHGDHMVAVFDTAWQAASSQPGFWPAMEEAARRLRALPGNGSAQVYAHGLEQLAAQLKAYGLDLDDLVNYIDNLLADEKGETGSPTGGEKRGEMLKALIKALAAWKAVEQGQPAPERPVDMGYLFDLGVAYMQAKAKGGSRAEVLGETAATVSPLNAAPHRMLSGKLAIAALLNAMRRPSGV